MINDPLLLLEHADFNRMQNNYYTINLIGVGTGGRRGCSPPTFEKGGLSPPNFVQIVLTGDRIT